MIASVLEALGGLGLFLLGLIVMTESLRRLAGGALRRTLARFTRSPASGAATGALTTALIQSSSATTVAAVGFVGAGLLTFGQALGILFGANVGTTLTGWLVALLGFKLHIGTVVPPLVLVGALMQLFGSRRTAAAGGALAGFGLIFIGIEVLQNGLAGFHGTLTPESFPPDTWAGRALGVGIGVVITLVTQSSSAGVATALAALNAGAIALPQACAMVIGMDVGTTVTAALATLGASTAARRTGWAHVIYNALTGVGAFLLLPLYLAALGRVAPHAASGDPELSLVAFHTGFNLLGVLAVLPLTAPFARLVEWLVPERLSPFARHLDRRLFDAPASALDAVTSTLFELADTTLDALSTVLREGLEHAEVRLDLIDLALAETRDYLVAIPVDPEDAATQQRQISALHTVDHLSRVIDRCRDSDELDALHGVADLAPLARRLHALVEELRPWLQHPASPAPSDGARAFWKELEAAKAERRGAVLAQAARGGVSGADALERLEATRWLRRVAHHLWRIAEHLERVQPHPTEPARAPAANVPDVR